MNGARTRRGRGGYTLVALLVGMTVASILIAAILPLASAQAQRDREAELIFRGLQYAEGIRVFRRRFGRYPNTLVELVEVKPRSIRKLWQDPMTRSDDWGIISIAGTPANVAPGTTPGPTPTPRPTPTQSPFRKTGGGAAGTEGLGGPGPVIGVFSKSTERGYRIWNGRQAYNEWRFTEASLTGSGGPVIQTPMPGIGGGGARPPGGSGGK